MKKSSILVITLIITIISGFTACMESSSADDSEQVTGEQSEGSLFIIGGGSRPESMLLRIIDETGIDREGHAIVLTMSGFDPDTSGYYGERQFRQLGIENIRSYDFGRTDDLTPSGRDSLENAALIYITGGSQSRFMDAVANEPGIAASLEKAHRNGAMLAGTSAGAAIMSRIMITGDQEKYPEYTSTFYHLEKDNIVTTEGLGLIEGVIIDQHFLKRARNNRLLTAVMEFPDHVGIGIDESTAILVRGGAAEVVGDAQVLVYQNQSGDADVNNGKLGARNILLDIYLPGDRFDI